MTEHRALEKKQITQGNNRKVQKPGGSLKRLPKRKPFFVYALNIKYSSALLTPSSSTEEVT